jgi:iron complex transport system substrate-binding protein
VKFIKLVLLVAIVTLLGSCQGGKGRPEGYVVLSPEVAEILCAIGAEDNILAVTNECDYPHSLASKAKVGSFSAIDVEAIIALNPEIVFVSALEQEGSAAQLKKLGIRVEVIYPKSLSELSKEILRLGEISGNSKQAATLVADMQQSLAQVKAETDGKAKPKVYLEIYRDPLMSVSDASFVGELIETAGGDNIFPTLERDYARVNPEAVIKARPDIMICYSQDSLQNIIARKGWQDIPAIRNGKIYFEKDISPDIIQRATPRSIDGIWALYKLIHGDSDEK